MDRYTNDPNRQSPYQDQQYSQESSGQPQYGQRVGSGTNSPYGPSSAPQYAVPPQSGYSSATQMVMDASTAYSRESAMKVSVTRAYAEMTAGLVVTAIVAVLTQMTGALEAFLTATGGLGWLGLAIVQVVVAIALGARAMSMRPGTARAVFYLYAALMGFTLSSIFLVYDLSSIGMALGLSIGFFFALTMLALTTKRDMLKAGPILFTALLVLIIGQVVLMFVAPSDTTVMVVSTIGLLIFAGLTAYDAQKTRALFASYGNDTVAIERLSIVCALNLYLDFVNMFLYLLRLFGGRN